jgi:hypothetical protein
LFSWIEWGAVRKKKKKKKKKEEEEEAIRLDWVFPPVKLDQL